MAKNKNFLSKDFLTELNFFKFSNLFKLYFRVFKKLDYELLAVGSIDWSLPHLPTYLLSYVLKIQRTKFKLRWVLMGRCDTDVFFLQNAFTVQECDANKNWNRKIWKRKIWKRLCNEQVRTSDWMSPLLDTISYIFFLHNLPPNSRYLPSLCGNLK